MSLGHDPHADPLPPGLRDKLEASFRPLPTLSINHSAPLTEIERETMAMLALGYSRERVASWRGVGRGRVDKTVQRARFKITGHTR
jgi:hypothetical protein